MATLRNINEIHLPLCAQRMDKQKRKVRHQLNILDNGLIVCKIRIMNPSKTTNQTIGYNETSCYALIDTGCEMSLICKSIYDSLSIEDAVEMKLSTVNKCETLPACNVNIFVPHGSWRSLLFEVFVSDLSTREYQAIIGMDVLSHFQLVYNGIKNIAWLEEI